MSEIITTTARTASTIAAEIRVIHEQARTSALLAIVEIGRRLVEAKELVDHGEWCSYLQTELGYKQSAANNYMKIYREYEANGLLANSQTFGNLSPSQALALIAVPADEREEFVQRNDAENMSARQLKQAIQERDAALKAQSDAQAQLEAIQRNAEAQNEEVRQARQELLVLQQQAATAKCSEAAWQEQIDKLNAKIAKLTTSEAKAKDKIKQLKENPTIPDAFREKLLADAMAEAEGKARAELQEQITAAQTAAETAAREREAAEVAARDAQEKLAAAQKNAKMSDPDVMAFNLLASQIQNNLNSLNGYRKKVSASNPEMGEKMKAFVIKMLEDQRKKVE